MPWLCHCFILYSTLYVGFPGDSVVKNLPAKAGDAGDTGLIPGWGRSPGGENGNPLQHPCLESRMDRGTWRVTVHGVAKSWMRLNTAPYVYHCSNLFIYLFACSAFSEAVTCGLPKDLHWMILVVTMRTYLFDDRKITDLEPQMLHRWSSVVCDSLCFSQAASSLS